MAGVQAMLEWHLFAPEGAPRPLQPSSPSILHPSLLCFCSFCCCCPGGQGPTVWGLPAGWRFRGLASWGQPGATQRGSSCLCDSLPRHLSLLSACPHYYCCCPGWGEAALREMFRDYWASGDPAVGEAGGGRGWAGWLVGERGADVLAGQQAQQAQREEAPAAEQEDQGPQVSGSDS